MQFLEQQKECAAQLKMDLNKAEQATLIKRWLNQSQREIWSRYDWPWARDREIVQTNVDKTAGTVSVSSGGTTVTGASTAFAAADIGKFIQFSSANDWYKITAVASATSLAIEKGYIDTSALSGGTYTIRQFYYAVSSNAEKILLMKQVSSPTYIPVISFRDFDIRRPNPESTGKAVAAAIWGLDSSNNMQFTLFPWPDEKYNIEIRIKKKVTDLSGDTDESLIPAKWNESVMIDGALKRGLFYNRRDQNDRLFRSKERDFEAGVIRMIEEAEFSSDYHPILERNESRVMPIFPLLPENFDRDQF